MFLFSVRFDVSFVFVGLGGPGGGFDAPGCGLFSTGSSGGLPPLLPVLKPPPGAPKPPPGPPKPPATKQKTKNNTKTKQKHCSAWSLIKFEESRHAQMCIYVVFHEEFDFQVENYQF